MGTTSLLCFFKCCTRNAATTDAPTAPARRDVKLKGRTGDEQSVDFTFDGGTVPLDPDRPVESLSEKAEKIEAAAIAWEKGEKSTS